MDRSDLTFLFHAAGVSYGELREVTGFSDRAVRYWIDGGRGEKKGLNQQFLATAVPFLRRKALERKALIERALERIP